MKIPVTTNRSDLSRELKNMLDAKMSKVHEQMLEYEREGDTDMANRMDSYVNALEYAFACILDLDEAYEKAYTISYKIPMEVA
jgi:hypothetical protein